VHTLCQKDTNASSNKNSITLFKKAGTFIIPKKDGRVHWVSNFCGLNKAIKQKVYPIPIISDVLCHQRRYKYLTKIDLSMQYYCFELDNASKELCTIATPFGLYCYWGLPMGVNQSPDIAQEIMECVLSSIMEEIECYINDIAAFADDWESHKTLLNKLLTKLQNAGFTVNPLKCKWAVQETNFLGHCLTPTGIKPREKKVQGILDMQAPTNIKQIRAFLGMVGYYHDMWPRHSHVLAPLAELTGKKSFVWEDKHQQAFEQMKALIATDALLAYPNHNKSFDIKTDASDYQLGAVIKQDNRPIAYYTRKLNSVQKNYTTIKKECLSTVKTLKEFQSMLLGAQITIYIDHKNLTHKLSSFSTQHVLPWRLLLDKFGCNYKYKEGSQNLVTDALSRVLTSCLVREKTAGRPGEKNLISQPNQPQEPYKGNQACIPEENPLLAECLLVYPVFDEHNVTCHPFHFAMMQQYQQRSDVTKQLLIDQPESTL
jgi:RNase H-like domain found in reverse transcriptase/Reverse transcriptase (RNA-dependent DNA polymerase)